MSKVSKQIRCYDCGEFVRFCELDTCEDLPCPVGDGKVYCEFCPVCYKREFEDLNDHIQKGGDKHE